MTTSVHYRLTAATRGSHRLLVAATFPTGPATLVFPSWAPGSYLMREFAKAARDFSAATADGSPVSLVQLSRNSWAEDAAGPFTLTYEVYCHEKSVRTPYLDAELAFFLPSNVLVYDRDRPEQRFVVELDAPAGHVAVCPLGSEVFGPAVARFEAPDLDTLMDSPISVGPFEHTTFEVDGVPHHHWIEPGHNGDLAKMNTDLRAIVVAARATVGGELPYRRYDFVTLHMRAGHGGLEHKDCSILLRPRLGFATPEGHEEFLTLAAHEHFHAWNVKRIHPDTLGPRFDYAQEHHTRDLWWLEGGTVYYEERIAYRSGAVTAERHLARLADHANKLRATVGARHLSLQDASFNAWVKLYRPTEDSGNSTVSYYLKGAVVIWAMDLELLHRTGGEAGVDTLLRELWERWGRHGRGYPEARTLLEIADRIAGGGGEWARWWAAHVDGTGPVALAAALDRGGWALVESGGASAGAWLGVGLRAGNRIVVDTVREDGPSAGALSPGDEILAFSGERVVDQELSDRLKSAAPGRPVTILLARDGRVRPVELVPAPPPPGDLKITDQGAIDPARERVRSAWLSRAPFT